MSVNQGVAVAEELNTFDEHDEPVAADAVLDFATAQELARIFQVLSDPTRVRLVALLAEGELCVHTITAALGMTQSAVSHQLRTMRDMRLVRTRRAGRHIFYTLDDAHVTTLFRQALAHLHCLPESDALHKLPTPVRRLPSINVHPLRIER